VGKRDFLLTKLSFYTLGSADIASKLANRHLPFKSGE
jgi:hypothetical protein